MRFFASVSALLAIAASAVAQTPDFDPIYAPKAGEVVPAGAPFTITWRTTPKYANERISISLLGGASQLQQVPISTIATGIDNSRESYSWNVDASLGEATVYSLVIRLESNPAVVQYSNSFQIKGNGKKSSASASATHSIKTTHTSSYAPSVTLQPNVTASYNTTTMTRNATTVCVVCNTTTMSATSRTFVTTTSWTSPSVTAPSVTSTPVVGAAAIVGAGSWGALAALAVAFFAL